MTASPQLILNFPASPDYTFASFYEWPGSQFAVSACRELVESETPPFPSLFLSGGPGSGKTHLLMAIGNAVAEMRPDQSALYLTCGDLVADTVSGRETDLPPVLTQLQSVDYCLIDDVDRMMGYAPAQEALYQIYNTLKDRDACVVFASRIPPGGIPETEDFLRSRFKWGLTVEIAPMDPVTAERVFQKLGQDLGLDIPDKVATYLLNRLPRDFASLRQAADRLNAESLAQKKKVTLPMAKTALDLL